MEIYSNKSMRNSQTKVTTIYHLSAVNNKNIIKNVKELIMVRLQFSIYHHLYLTTYYQWENRSKGHGMISLQDRNLQVPIICFLHVDAP